jgi:hypothetical protein
MAITSIGYDGSVNESEWAKMIPLVGSSQYGVFGAGDFKVTPHATMDRGVNIATGSAWGHGVYDTSDATISLQGASVASGSRWDLVVVRRNWSGTGGATTVAIVQGTATRALPARNTTPGTIDDQPLALVQFTAGQTAPTSIVDLRCFSRNGGLVANDDLALTYLKEPGASVMVSGVQWNCEMDGNGNPSWTTFVSGRIPLFGAPDKALDGPAGSNPMNMILGGQQFLIQAGSTVQRTDGSGYARITWPKIFPNGLLTVILTNGDSWASTGAHLVVEGNASFWGSSGTGSRWDVVYMVRYWLNNNDMARNLQHRVNWIAIGW